MFKQQLVTVAFSKHDSKHVQQRDLLGTSFKLQINTRLVL